MSGSRGRGRTIDRRKRAAPATSKVIVEFPSDLLERAERAASELATNRSRLIRLAVEQFLQGLQRRELERELAEGYRANAALDREICQEFAYVDAENI
jgi:metal-responsive CopG/Arc/MetJ family transcriptional regulator